MHDGGIFCDLTDSSSLWVIPYLADSYTSDVLSSINNSLTLACKFECASDYVCMCMVTEWPKGCIV